MVYMTMEEFESMMKGTLICKYCKQEYYPYRTDEPFEKEFMEDVDEIREKMKEFKPINKWRNRILHLRNIEITLEVLNGRTYAETGKLYELSRNRIMQVYRRLVCELYARNFGGTVHMAYDKKCYQSEDMKKIVSAYHKEYVFWMSNKHEQN